MDIADIWTAHIKRLVDEEAAQVGGNKRSGYRAVADKTHHGQEYVYQIYTGRKKPGKDFAAAVGRVYANGRDPSWINAEDGLGESLAGVLASSGVERPATVNPALAQLNAYFLELEPDEQAAVLGDLFARASKAVGARTLQQVTGYAPPSPVAPPREVAYSDEAQHLADFLDSLSPEARKRAFAQAQTVMSKAEEAFRAPPADVPVAPAPTKARALRS